MKLDRPLLCFDIETTGVDVCKDRIIELGVTILNPDMTVNPRGWSRRFNPEIPIPAAATEVHGITDEMVKDCPPFSTFAPALHQRLTGKDLAGYNLWRLDLPMLDEEFRRCGLKLDLTGVNVIDIQGIFFKKEPRSLADAVRRYCKREHEGAHGAGEDAAATLDVFLEQLVEYSDIPDSIAGAAEFSRLSDNPFVDVAGKLYRDKEGFACFAFGKNKGLRVQEQLGYARWMLEKGQFPGSTLDAIREELDRG